MEVIKIIKPGIFSWFSYPLPLEERLRLIKQSGFDAVSLWWDGDERYIGPDMAERFGLEIDNIHAPFNNPNSFWFDCLGGEDYFNMLISCINDCRRYDIPAVVAHITGFTDPPKITPIGIDRVKKLAACCEENNICLAFENLNYLEHLDYIFENIKSDHIGFCYDSGHEYLYHRKADCLKRYGNRLLALHIDDNFGDDDTHLLPFDGSVNWAGFREKLRDCRDISCMTLEANFNRKHEKSKIYEGLPVKDFLALAHEKLSRVFL